MLSPGKAIPASEEWDDPERGYLKLPGLGFRGLGFRV